MEMKRRTFLTGLAAACCAATLPTARAGADHGGVPVATLIDLTRCDGCEALERPLCVSACRKKNAERFPQPDPAMLKDYWPKKYHEDWSGRRDIDWRLTPYNWLFIEEVYLEIDGREQKVSIPRRCMHCDNPPCVKLCPFGTAKKERNGPVHIDPTLCFGGAKCRAVCPWHVPQRQSGVGIYTTLDPVPVGGGVMYKCDLCRDLLAKGEEPACHSVCPKQAMTIGPRDEILHRAQKLANEYDGYLYGQSEHGGTSTLYVSRVDFAAIDAALTEDMKDTSRVMRFHQPDNRMNSHASLAQAALLAPLAGVVGAFAATVAKKEHKDEE